MYDALAVRSAPVRSGGMRLSFTGWHVSCQLKECLSSYTVQTCFRLSKAMAQLVGPLPLRHESYKSTHLHACSRTRFSRFTKCRVTLRLNAIDIGEECPVLLDTVDYPT